MGREDLFIMMGMCMKETGLMIKLKAMALIRIQTVQSTRVSGVKTSRRGGGGSGGRTGPPSRGTTWAGRSTARAPSPGRTGLRIAASSPKIILKAMGSTGGQTADFTWVTGRTTKCTVVVVSPGLTVASTRASTRRTKSTGRASSSGRTGAPTKDSGPTENNTELVSTKKKMDKQEQENG